MNLSHKSFRAVLRGRSCRALLTLLPVTTCALLLLAASPPAETSTDELIRQANAAVLRGDLEDADRLYRAAEETATDPGLVAFNRGAVLFQLGQYRDAELHYRCVLDDRDCPPERQARAWYNRGTCLVRRGGAASIYRAAIADFERCLESPAADEPLRADARHNLEIAKIQWNLLRKTNPKPESPNDLSPDDASSMPDKSPERDPQAGAPEPGDGNVAAGNAATTVPQAVPQAAPGANRTTAKTDPGHAPNLQPLEDSSTVQPLSPEDTREHLKRAAERIKKDRRDLLKTLYGPERPGRLDW